jgi:chitodextrinase/endonuclease/exonuclease/phosphatase family metal-dependent hydrolase
MLVRPLLAALVVGTVVFTPRAEAQMDCSAATPVYDIQGRGHISPLVDQVVVTCGVVTAVGFSGYYIQDVEGDGDNATSDGIFISEFDDKPDLGAWVEVSATVTESIGGGAATGNLSVTTLLDATVQQSEVVAAFPEPVLIGGEGRIPPDSIVISASEVDPPINLQEADDAAESPFNPEVDGIDFYESLEGMLVSVSDPVAVSAIRQFGRFSAEVFVLADDGEKASVDGDRTLRGGIRLGADRDNQGDQNPERIQIQFDGTLFGSLDYPEIKVSDRLQGVSGVMSYSFGNFEVVQLGALTVLPSELPSETTSIMPTRNDLTLASYNVLNLSAVPGDDDQRALVAEHIAINLDSPDIVALQEVQDNNGDIGDCPSGEPEDCAGVLDASLTLSTLVDAIVDAGGPAYEFATVDPLVETTDDNRDDPDAFGGVSLGNIRNAYLYNPARVDLVGVRNLTRDILAVRGVSVPAAFDTSRDPLEGIFEFKGETIQVLNNHFSSRFGSTPIFGGPQPFVQAGEIQRGEQSRAMHEWVATALAEDKDARFVVLGDLNTFEFTDELAEILPSASGSEILINLIDTEADGAAYSFIFEGNSQALDHIFATPTLAASGVVDYVHVNVDYPRLFSTEVGSDHEPLLARFRFDDDSVGLDLRGEVYSQSALELFWTRNDQADAYAVYRDGRLLATIDGISYFEEGLASGTTYDYVVVSLAQGEPLDDDAVSLTTRGKTIPMGPAAVINLTGAVYSSTAVEIFWDIDQESRRAVGFNVLRDGELLTSRNARSYFEEGLMPGTRYRYEVIAYDADGNQSRPQEIELTTNPSVSTQTGPGAVTSLSGLVYSSTAIEIFWKAPATVDGPLTYNVYRDDVPLQSSDGFSFFDASLAPATAYEYTVDAVDENGVRGPLSRIELTTRAQ